MKVGMINGKEEIIFSEIVLYKDSISRIEIVNNKFAYYTDISMEFIPMSVQTGKYIAERFNWSVEAGCNCLDRLESIRKMKIKN